MIIMDVQSLVKSFEEIKNKSENLRKKMEKEKKILELSNKIDKLKQELEELQKKPYEISYPDDGEKIYYISHYFGQVKEWDFNISNEADKCLYDIGLYFDTEEEAEQFKRERALIKKIKCWAKEQQGDWKPDWRNDEAFYEVQFNRFPRHFDEDVLVINGVDEFVSISTLPYFKNYKIAQACIDEFGDEILEVFC